MKQQINLYQGAVRRESPAFGARAMVASFALCIVVLGGAWYWAQGHARELATQLASIKEQESAAAARLDALGETLNGLKDNEGASSTLREALDGLARREQLLALIDGPALGDTGGFSSSLRALARHTLDGVWLTRIAVSAPGSRTNLAGRARDPHLVPEYLLGLAAEPALSGQRFDQFEIERDDDPSSVRFAMASAAAERAARRGDAP